MVADAVIIAAIVAIPPTLTAMAGLVVALHNRSKLGALHVQINSRLDQLLMQQSLASHAAGMAEGIEQERGRGKELP